MKKLTASLHHPNGDVMECVTAQDGEPVAQFVSRIIRRWTDHMMGHCRVVISSTECG